MGLSKGVAKKCSINKIHDIQQEANENSATGWNQCISLIKKILRYGSRGPRRYLDSQFDFHQPKHFRYQKEVKNQRINPSLLVEIAYRLFNARKTRRAR